jgi:hypothetical protein
MNAEEIINRTKDAHDTIKEAFDGTTSKLTPLFDRIRGTDGLIDQIVYGLYGLTEEEIKVVEQTS